MIQWIIVALILAATLLAIVRRYRRPRRCDASCADCPLAQNCNKNGKR